METITRKELNDYFQTKLDELIMENQKAGKEGRWKDVDWCNESIGFLEIMARDLGCEVSENGAYLY